MSRQSRLEDEKPILAAGAQLIVAREELATLSSPAIWQCTHRQFRYRIHCQGQSLWLIIEWPDGGAIAARPVYAPGCKCEVIDVINGGESVRMSVESSLGVYHTHIDLPSATRPLIHWRTSLSPTENLAITDWPGDLYPVDSDLDPLGAAGAIHTSQKGPTGAILYATVNRPWQGSFLYAQNLTALNEFFERTHTSAKDCISNRWPEVGFRLPSSDEHWLLAGEETVISDAYLLATPDAPVDKLKAARLFLDLYADLYLELPKPEATFRDWPRLVDQTTRDLTHSNACGIEKRGKRYLLAYVGADDRPPESMVQLALLLPMIEYEEWLGEKITTVDQIRANLPSFYRSEVQTVVRWLPGDSTLQGQEEHMNEETMDSWYLYHTYMNLSRLAHDGDKVARELFLKSVEYGIAVARHFSYHWPVFYNIHTLDVIKSQTKPGRGGEHDVGAQYVHVMMQAWDLTGEDRYLDEAERAAQALEGLGFDLGYQFNNTTFGAGGLLRLWKATGKRLYLELSFVCIANVVRNFWLWECDYGYAKNYHTFLGVIPLRDAEYLAVYEELETLAAFHDYLAVGGDDVPRSIRLILCEFCKYAIDRAWYYYPGNLPREMVEEKPRSGHINRHLAIPLEDIYEGWQKAGKVGQEVYGAAAPFVFATRHCHRIDGVKFRIHCDYPTAEFTIRRRKDRPLSNSGAAGFQIAGDRRCRSYVRIVPDDFTPLPKISLQVRSGKRSRQIEGQMSENGFLEFEVPGDALVSVKWQPQRRAPEQSRAESNGSLHVGGNRSKRYRSSGRR